MSALPPNVHVSRHPCLRAKLSQLRSRDTGSRDTNALVRDIATIVGCEAMGEALQTRTSGTDQTPLGDDYAVETIAPEKIALVPILRSGLAMIEAIQSLLPTSVAVHHLGLFREPTTLQPVEYYNNLPFHPPPPSSSSSSSSSPAEPAGTTTTTNPSAASLAILIDPIVATGSTAAAAIQTLREWGVQRVVLLSVLGSRDGLARVAAEWSGGQGEGADSSSSAAGGTAGAGDGVQIYVGAVDEKVDERGMIVPGVGDVGDRLFLAAGK